MRLVIQRVSSASVTIEGEKVSAIGKGALVLVGVGHDDTKADAEYLAGKAQRLRMFEDEKGLMNLAASDVGGEFLVVSQFTLYGDCRKGNRPGWSQAAPPDMADKLYLYFVECLKKLGCAVQTGRFREHMMVDLCNDGPVTLLLESTGR